MVFLLDNAYFLIFIFFRLLLIKKNQVTLVTKFNKDKAHIICLVIKSYQK